MIGRFVNYDLPFIKVKPYHPNKMKKDSEQRPLTIAGLPPDSEVEIKIKPSAQNSSIEEKDIIRESKKVALSSVIKELISKLFKWPF